MYSASIHAIFLEYILYLENIEFKMENRHNKISITLKFFIRNANHSTFRTKQVPFLHIYIQPRYSANSVRSSLKSHIISIGRKFAFKGRLVSQAMSPFAKKNFTIPRTFWKLLFRRKKDVYTKRNFGAIYFRFCFGDDKFRQAFLARASFRVFEFVFVSLRIDRIFCRGFRFGSISMKSYTAWP